MYSFGTMSLRKTPISAIGGVLLLPAVHIQCHSQDGIIPSSSLHCSESPDPLQPVYFQFLTPNATSQNSANYSTSSILLAVFCRNLGKLASTSFIPPLVLEQNSWNNRYRLFMGQIPFLSNNQQCCSTELNSKHWSQPGKITHWSHPFCLTAGFQMEGALTLRTMSYTTDKHHKI